MKRLLGSTLFASKTGVTFLSFFLCGFSFFWFLGIRAGPHPSSWRQMGAQNELSRILVECSNEPNREKLIGCVQDNFVLLVRRWGLHELMMALERRQMTEDPYDYGRAYCHDLSHLLGAASVEAGVGISDVLRSCTNVCQSGCFHGAAAAWVTRGGNFFADFPSYCFNSKISEVNEYSCVHGLGHAIVDVGGYDLNNALSFCDLLPEESRPGCGSGALMEMFVWDNSPYVRRNPLPVPENHPDWCKDIPAPYDEICFSYAGLNIYSQTRSLERAAAVCSREPAKYRLWCLIDAAKFLYFSFPPNPEHIEDAKVYCSMYAHESYEECMNGIFANTLK